MATLEDAKRNHLLAALPESELKRIVGLLKPRTLGLGDSIYESGSKLHYFVLSD